MAQYSQLLPYGSVAPSSVSTQSPLVGADDVLGHAVNVGVLVGLALTEPPQQRQHMTFDEKPPS